MAKMIVDTFVQGTVVQGDLCPGGQMSKDSCQETFVQGNFFFLLEIAISIDYRQKCHWTNVSLRFLNRFPWLPTFLYFFR